MDRRNTITAKTTAKTAAKRTSPASGRVIPFWIVHLTLGFVLITAGAVKFYELAFECVDESLMTLLIMTFSEVEIAGGIYIAVGVNPARARRWATAAFAGFAAASLFQAIAGKCSCGCFGSLAVNPWYVLVFDLAAVAALKTCRTPADLDPTRDPQPLGSFGIGLAALLVCLGAWLQSGQVTLAGTATVNGRPLEKAELAFNGNSGSIGLQTDSEGHFRLRLVRPGLYSVSSPGMVIPNVVENPQPDDLAKKSKTGKRRPKQETMSLLRTGGGEAFLWIEISSCSEYDRVINFR